MDRTAFGKLVVSMRRQRRFVDDETCLSHGLARTLPSSLRSL